MAARSRLFAGLVLVGMAVAPGVAMADFFDDARRTFTNDIPQFFQDDVPCTFGGRPTSGARAACKQDKTSVQPQKAAPRPARVPEQPVRR